MFFGTIVRSLSLLSLALTVFKEGLVFFESVSLVVDDLLNGLNLLVVSDPVMVQPKDMTIKAKTTDLRIFKLSNNELFLGCSQIKSSISKDFKVSLYLQ